MSSRNYTGQGNALSVACILVLVVSLICIPGCRGRSAAVSRSAPSPSPSTATHHNISGPTASNHSRLLSPPKSSQAAFDTPSSDGKGSSGDSLLWLFLIGPAVFILFLLVLLLMAIVCFRRKRRAASVSPWKAGMSGNMSGQLQKPFVTGVPSISREEVEAACEDFSNIIGSSRDSIVFKGTLTNGTEIAVTSIRIPPASWTPNTELYFRRKVEGLARMNHKNLVNLVAYCSSEEPFERMLIFEYAPNGTFYEHLHNKESEHLDWPTRMRIVMGAAYGLQYMHHELVPPTSHLNFDASSVYLSEDYAAKVADFGISKLSVGSNSGNRRRSFSKVFTAIGYDDWEGADRHTPDFESNVYSFGVFLLEGITGRAVYSETRGLLTEWAKEYLNDSKMMWYMVDPSLKSYNNDELVAVCEIIRLCLLPKASKRPSMREVTWMLSSALHMTAAAASSKNSPLLWAELEILSTVENTCEEPEVLA